MIVHRNRAHHPGRHAMVPVCQNIVPARSGLYIVHKADELELSPKVDDVYNRPSLDNKDL